MLRRRQPVGRRGPGLARTIARTAVIAGTATAVSGSVTNAQAQRQQAAQEQADERQQLADLQQQVSQIQAQEVQAQMTPAGGADDMIGQLARLGELHQQGILSSEEFAAAKAKLLGM
jgi:hypothetical protein